MLDLSKYVKTKNVGRCGKTIPRSTVEGCGSKTKGKAAEPFLSRKNRAILDRAVSHYWPERIDRRSSRRFSVRCPGLLA